ncbi:amino acid adenylation domain-containing protein [filamentous cyanobacterium LEGE 11480]|uniref:Amino acid adenylation domain-containing protein n=1 Tax=Romeriopsis navalis LEGE 11480 TaxID=2777977 RepID=A0A928VI64_9CYAN|nr:amino acid adenylation domain-containing protein [Romeriopsis navalis]MBE9028223.1 amino acid adenylation domain-containing protein [Romeriopsis navalis LEGE 11480]
MLGISLPQLRRPARSEIDVTLDAPAPRQVRYPLSPMQQGMLFHSLYQPQSGTDIEQIICTLNETVQVEYFVQAWQQILVRYDSLRTTITDVATLHPQQVVHPQLATPFEQQNWCDDSPMQQAEKLELLLASDRLQGFDLLNPAAILLRLRLIQLDVAKFKFIWTFHHLLLDGRSITQILQEVFALYDALRRAAHLPLPIVRPYQDYIAWQQQQNFCDAQPFWQDLLQGFNCATPLLPIQAMGETAVEPGHQNIAISLSSAQTAALQEYAAAIQVTPNTIIQGVWGILLSRYSGKQDVVFGTVRACRKTPIEGVDSMVGLLINTLPVRVQPQPDLSVREYLQALRAQHVAVRPYEQTPLMQIQTWSEIPGGTALLESLVLFENYQINEQLQQADAAWADRHVEFREQPSFPLVLMAAMGKALQLKVSYDQTRFDRPSMERLLGHLQMLLTSLLDHADPLEHPDLRLAALTWLTTAETEQLLVQWNQTDRSYASERLLHELFEQQVSQNPAAVALVYGDQQMTYGELNQRSNQLAQYLVRQGLSSGEAVGVYLDRGFELVIALFAVLKAGGAYVPFEPTYPDARVQWIMDSLALRYMIAAPQYQAKLVPLTSQLAQFQQLVLLDLAATQMPGVFDFERYAAENLTRRTSATSRAYIIFTSGSTGTPKGVVVNHQSVTNLIDWVNREFEISATDRALFITSVCFDLSVYDMFGLLAAGGSLQIASNAEIQDPHALIRLLQTAPITFWNSAPPMLQQLVPLLKRRQTKRRQPAKASHWLEELDRRQIERRQVAGSNSQLRLIFLSGDWVPISLPDFLKDQFPDAQVVALGGATEATVWSNFYVIDQIDARWNSIPYGKPIQNSQYYILDEQLRPCPIGVTGELYIGGDCLAVGYTDVAKTEAQFIPYPFGHGPTDRLYRTGDLARFFPDGNIEFLGRIDHQVKIRGFRIELGEIATVLMRHPDIETAIVLAQDLPIGDRYDPCLVAYVVLKAGIKPAEDTTVWSLTEFLNHELPNFLREYLPGYMIPHTISAIHQIPLTSNGKLDRQALQPVQLIGKSCSIYRPPTTLLEHQLVEIWSNILGIATIGCDDNFFDLGGHSLLAVELIAQIEAVFDHQLSLSVVFRAPTVSAMAQLLKSDTIEYLTGAMIPVNRGAPDRTPLFLCQFYDEIAPYLPPDLPVYGLDAGIFDIRQPQDHICRYAKDYVVKIRAVQPEGPYYLGGYCFGGYLALEIAQQLKQQGQVVDLVVLLESYGPNIPFYQSGLTLPTMGLLLASVKRRWREKQRLKRLTRCSEMRLPNDVVIPREPVQAAVRHYPLGEYDGEVLLLSGDTSHLGSRFLPRLGWGQTFTGKCTIKTLDGGHMTLLESPYIQQVVASIDAAMRSRTT